MQIELEWGDIAVRLGGATVAGICIGLNRGERGKPAGLRTTLLVCLAAALAMVLANSLIGTHGKVADSFVQLDFMRLPLGILTGIGFIGAGTILKKGDLVVGVTTAATIWFVTVIGLCFGAGQVWLGAIGTGMGLLTLTGLAWVENRLRQEHHAVLEVLAEGSEGGVLSEEQLRGAVESFGYQVSTVGTEYEQFADGKRRRRYWVDVRWRAARLKNGSPGFLAEIAGRAGVVKVGWKGESGGRHES